MALTLIMARLNWVYFVGKLCSCELLLVHIPHCRIQANCVYSALNESASRIHQLYRENKSERERQLPDNACLFSCVGTGFGFFSGAAEIKTTPVPLFQ
jgi:hypothetical protein